jgi:hypothetical protein
MWLTFFRLNAVGLNHTWLEVQHMVVMRRDPNPEKQAIYLDLAVLPSGAFLRPNSWT